MLRSSIFRVSWLLPFIVGAAIVQKGLPANTLYAGTDPGFSFTGQIASLQREIFFTWSLTGFGSVNFYNFSTTPFYLMLMLIRSFHGSADLVSHLYEVLEIGSLGAAAYFLASQFLVEAGVEVAARNGRALYTAALVMFSPVAALMALVPASLYQPAFSCWMLIFGCAMMLTRRVRSLVAYVLFGALLVFATSFNLAHTIIGLIFLSAFLVHRLRDDRSRLATRHLLVVSLSSWIILMTPFWLPVLFFKLLGGAPVFANTNLELPSALIAHVARSNALTGFSELLRFRGTVWWGDTHIAKFFDGRYFLLAAYALSLAALVGIFNRRICVKDRIFFGTAWLVFMFLAKGAHEPLGAYYLKFVTLPGGSLFRESNDKFLLGVLLAVTPLAAAGLQTILASKRRTTVALAMIILLSVPFMLGFTFDPGFKTSVPADYAAVQNLIAGDSQGRIISFPGAYNDQNSTYWFHGSNMDNMLFSQPVTYASMFQVLGTSSAPLFEDDTLRKAEEEPEIVSAAQILGAHYVLVHLDYTERLDMVFEPAGRRINGYELGHDFARRCDRDSRLERLFAGNNLLLYKLRRPVGTPALFSSVRAVHGYANALFADLLAWPNHSPAFFTGVAQDLNVEKIPHSSFGSYEQTFVLPPPSGLSSQEILSSSDLELALNSYFSALHLPRANLGAMPPGDIVAGSQASDALFLSMPPLSAGAKTEIIYKAETGRSSLGEWHSLATRMSAEWPRASDFGAPRVDPRSAKFYTTDIPFNGPITGQLYVNIVAAGIVKDFGAPSYILVSLEDGERFWLPFSWTAITNNSSAAFMIAHFSHTEEAIAEAGVDISSAIAALKAASPAPQFTSRPRVRSIRLAYFTLKDAPATTISAKSVRLFNDLPETADTAHGPIGNLRIRKVIPHGLTITSTALSSGGTSLVVAPVPGIQSVPPSVEIQLVPTTLITASVNDIRGYAFVDAPALAETAVTGTMFNKSIVHMAPIPLVSARYGLFEEPFTIGVDGARVSAEQNYRLDIDVRKWPNPSLVGNAALRLRLDFPQGVSGETHVMFSTFSVFSDKPPATSLGQLLINGHLLNGSAENQGTSVTRVRIASRRDPSRGMVQTGMPGTYRPVEILEANRDVRSTQIGAGVFDNPTLATLTAGAAGLVELGTTYNKLWVIRSGSPRHIFGFSALPTLLLTKPVSAAHIPVDGFANGWWVAGRGTYSMLFLPQAAREFGYILVSLAILVVGLTFCVRSILQNRVAR